MWKLFPFHFNSQFLYYNIIEERAEEERKKLLDTKDKHKAGEQSGERWKEFFLQQSE